MEAFIRQEKQIPVTQRADVLVAGGGIAGVAAALAAARSGKKTLLCEKEYLLGGLATVGMVALYLPIDDGNGKQVSFGLAEELLRLTVKDGPARYRYNGKDNVYYPAAWLEGKPVKPGEARFRTHYNPYIYALDLENLLTKEGVEILYGTWVADARVENGVLTHVILENIDGRTAVEVGGAVDATGDAVLAQAAGEETAVWPYGNVHSAWYMTTHDGMPDLVPFSEKIALPGKPLDEGKTVVSGLDARENSCFLRETHAMLLQDLAKKTAANPETQIVTMPTIPDMRMTRRIVGLTQSEARHEGQYLPDSVGCFGNWRKPDGGYELPLGSLFGARVKNLTAAGRCMSAADDIWDLTRVIPVCAVTGEAAGVAAAMSRDLPSLPVADVQAELVRRSVKLHLKDC